MPLEIAVQHPHMCQEVQVSNIKGSYKDYPCFVVFVSNIKAYFHQKVWGKENTYKVKMVFYNKLLLSSCSTCPSCLRKEDT